MVAPLRPYVALLCTTAWLLAPASAEILTPPYFNLASGKRITATATCGDEGPELYCKLVGANADNEEHVIQGQVCDICDSNTPSKMHPPEFAVDGMETRWQSPPLSRGMKYNEVNLTIDLGQEFHVAYVYIRMGNSPRPGLWALEKSMDYGKTFVPWQYFSDSPQDCERYFGKESLQPITKDDSVICSTEYSKIVPLEGGEIPISLLNYRPSANRYFYSSVLQEWTRATNVRLRLIKTKNLLGHLMSVARQDPTVTRRYFYSIKDISIGGRCMCNGHAENCSPDDPKSESNILVCRCQHNTCGPQCAQCCPGFEQKKWRISKVEDRFTCEPCNCHNHTTECTYDAEVDEKHLSLDIKGRYEGGGVCQNCQHNTEGINCNKCKSTFYKPYNREWHEIDVCQPCNCDRHFSTGNCKEEGRRKMCECRKEFNPPHCDSCAYGYFDYPNCKPCTCNLNGTEDNHCTPTDGMCPCKYNYAGHTCETCADGYYSPQCKNCECNNIGSVSPICDKESGNCTCKSKYSGRTCNQCQAGYYNYPSCSPCNCDTSGTVPSICDDVSGECKCKEGFGGSRCDQCISGFYMEVRGREKVCIPCNCSATGSTSTSCTASGKCNCLSNFGGKQCDQCSPGYYKYPECLPCNCDLAGSIGTSCDDNGQCSCRPNFDGIQCDHCKEHFYNYPACEECNCDPRGVIPTFAGCGSVPAGELCQCKDRVQGRICNDCKQLFWNLQEYNPQGCQECGCSLSGTIGGLGTCDTKTGQCNCKPHVWERKCDQCADGFYRLDKSDMFGCTECDCDIGGAVDNNCNKQTGQCRCHSRVEGRRCDQPIQAHYFPTLHQFQYEVEEGRTQSGQVRYRSAEETFPGYSWKGYVVFSIVQNEVINIVHITKSSLYRMVLRYVNPNKDPIVATIVITPENVGDTHQTFSVLFKPTSSPQFVTVSGEKGNAPAPFVMNPGNWTVTIKANKVLIDYFVLMPEPYYEARVLTKMVDKPCVIGDSRLCRLYSYPRLNGRDTADVSNVARGVNYYIDDVEQLKELNAGTQDIPLLNNEQNDLQYELKIDTPGTYYILVEYVTPIDKNLQPTDFDEQNYLNGTYAFSAKGSVTVTFQSGDNPAEYALLYLPDCPYLTPCRQIVVDDISKIQPVEVRAVSNTITLEPESDTVAGIKSIVFIPESEWHIDYITPKPYCLRKDGQCTPAIFSKDSPISSKKIEIESGVGGDREARPPILDNSTNVVYLGSMAPELKLENKVPNPGEYIFVIHYFQPSHPESVLDVVVKTDNQEFDASIPIEHCPSNSGCRTIIQNGELSNHFPITENFTLTFNICIDPDQTTKICNINILDSPEGTAYHSVEVDFTMHRDTLTLFAGVVEVRFETDYGPRATLQGERSQGVWLDLVLVVSSDIYQNSILKDSNIIDFTRDFISNCASNHYYIGTNETGFCRDSVFSITSEYNSGALQCYCQYEGSTDLECEKFGGQCRCKPNVIGRTCSACKTGYYGYPDCRPCDCPSTAVCNDYGECICPRNVIGPNCDRCKPHTFNFDMFHGCDDCNCNRLGVIDGELQCDSDNGNCACQKYVMGRTCDHCVPGHYSFPFCQPCDCNLAGTTADVCDQNTAQCYCKKHTKGQACDTCREEYYNLQADNPDGCTKCHCFGKTTRCTSSNFIWEQIYGMEDWYLVNVDVNDTINIFPHLLPPTLINVTTIAADLQVDDANHKVVYFGAPNQYLGERLTSYGGILQYTVAYTAGLFGGAISAADVVLGGANGFIFHHSIEQPPAATSWMHSLKMVEDEFTNLDGSPVTRDQFMNILIKLNAIYIRATYWEDAVTTRLERVSLEVAVESGHWDPWNSNNLALSVEVCSCPPGYRGLSCEHCAQGHYRLSTGTHAGSCVQCQCNGHSNTCDVNTGVCLNCDHNTMGEHCEQCIPGYHGDATFGTQNDCLICACPLPVVSNNFAVGCELSDNGTLISCDCLPGYGGAGCNYCTAGYYGKPVELGNSCKPCNCSGNINVDDPSSCDTISGSCLKCDNNTSGPACNICAPGFFGDAIFEKNCTPCVCDEFGMEVCDSTTGTCVCRPGVIGDRCDRCEPNYYGLSSGYGCAPCECGLASNATQCDDDSGQCKCAKGVTGRRCDMCAAGYWNYTQDGCDHCNCNTGYSVGFMCNTQTGQCECLPDVVGEKCDRCPDRWVLIPHEGCIECDSCTDALLYSVQDLSDWLRNETQDFKDKADSYFTTQRLNYISNQIQTLQPRLVSLKKLDLYNVTSAVDGLENSAKNSLRSAEFAATDSEEQITRAASLAAAAADELRKSKAGSQLARDAVRQVGDLASGLELSQQPRAESAVIEAKQIYADINDKDIGPKNIIAHSLYVNATQQIERMNVFVQPVLDQTKEFEALRVSTQDLSKKLNDMLKYTNVSEHTATEAEKLSANNRKSKFNDKIQSVSKQNDGATKDLTEAAHHIEKVGFIQASYTDLSSKANGALQNIDQVRNNIEERIKSIDNEKPELYGLKNDAERHVAALRSRAHSLKQLADREGNNSRRQDAYTAASAYSSIVQELEDAKKAANDAKESLNKAAEINVEIKDRVNPAFERSVRLKNDAQESNNEVTFDLGPALKRIETNITLVNKTLSETEGGIYAIQFSLPTQNAFTLDEQKDKADRVNSTVKKTLDIMAKMGGGIGNDKIKAESLPKVADDTLKKTSNIKNYIDSINYMTPNMTNTFNSVEDKQKELEQRKKAADEKLGKLSELIEQARAVANQINVGVDFDSTSTLQPRLPDTIDEMSTSTQVSTYFRTTNKNGMLLYLGNPKNTKLRRTKSDDFMVLEIQNGYPYLVMDIGDSLESGREPARINSDKYVADDKWYQVIVNRVGRNVKLTIRESLDDGTDKWHVNEATLPGQHTIFNLHREKSKLYVGGAPADHGLQGITYRAFDGQIEELMIGDTPVGLWNFENAQNIRGARQRDKLTSSQSGPTEYRFNGRGHVTMIANNYVRKQKNNILLFFRTYASDGLIYLVGEKDSFFSVQMQDGYIYLQICLGDPNHLLILGTFKKYNDGKWHKLDAKRFLRSGVLIIDNDPPLKGEALSLDISLRYIDTMNFGGNNNGIVQITNKGFDGCLRQISIDRLTVDLTENIQSIGVTTGCQFASLVSFDEGNGFLRYDNITADGFQSTLKFKTSQPDGLIFVYLSRQQTITSDSISLSMDQGKLVLMSQNERLDTGVYTYSDNNWHVVTVTHNSKQLSMVVDDFDKFGTDSSPAALHVLDGVLFVGGVQPGYVLTVKIGNKTPFLGCIGDTTINGVVLNLLEPNSNGTVTFGRCGRTTTTGGANPEGSWPPPSYSFQESTEPFAPYTLAALPEPVTTPVPPTTTKVFPVGRDKAPTTPKVQATPAPPSVKPVPVKPARLRPPPVAEAGCALAFDPEYLIGGPTEGYRFGSRNDSRIEFDRLPGRQHDGFDLSMSLRTFDTDGGLIFYASSDETHEKYLALYMRQGKLNLRMDCGGSPVHVTSVSTYNDTLWHNVTVSLDATDRCKLSADNQFVGEGVGVCTDKLTLQAPFYYGGLYQLTAAIKNNLNDFYKPFMGCLKQLTMNGQPVTDIRRRQTALQCTDDVEDGVYFAPPGGFLKLRKNFKVGREISIYMEIKPRNSSGLLLSVHGKRDFMVLELIDNEVVVNVENGKGPFQASFKLPDKYSLCDGNWHKVIAVKSNHVVTVGVDGHFSNPGLGSSSSTDTKSAIYIGGHERRLSLVPGIKSKTGYSGCIRKISISNESQDTLIPIPPSAAHGNVHVGVCPKQ